MEPHQAKGRIAPASRLVHVGHQRDGDAPLLVFWGAAVIEWAHPDLLHPGEFHPLLLEEAPDGFDPALGETVVVIARARKIAESPELHDQGRAGLELVDHVEERHLCALRQVRLVEGEVNLDRVHDSLPVAVRPETREAAIHALDPVRRGIRPLVSAARELVGGLDLVAKLVQALIELDFLLFQEITDPVLGRASRNGHEHDGEQHADPHQLHHCVLLSSGIPDMDRLPPQWRSPPEPPGPPAGSSTRPNISAALIRATRGDVPPASPPVAPRRPRERRRVLESHRDLTSLGTFGVPSMVGPPGGGLGVGGERGEAGDWVQSRTTTSRSRSVATSEERRALPRHAPPPLVRLGGGYDPRQRTCTSATAQVRLKGRSTSRRRSPFAVGVNSKSYVSPTEIICDASCSI